MYKDGLPVDRQEEDYYHGTKLCCNLISTNLPCTATDCGICGISNHGFDPAKIRRSSFQRFGPGFYLAPKSSKCHDYTVGAHSYRALLLCSVHPGNKYELTRTNSSLSGPPQGYHSIFGKTGVNLNYNEIVLSDADAILPKFIILYQKDGERGIAK